MTVYQFFKTSRKTYFFRSEWETGLWKRQFPAGSESAVNKKLPLPSCMQKCKKICIPVWLSFFVLAIL